MKAAMDGDGCDGVAVGLNDGSEDGDARGVGAGGDADEESAADAEDVAAFNRGGERDLFDVAIFAQLEFDARGFETARFGAHGEEDGQFIEDDGGVFDEDRVGEGRLTSRVWTFTPRLRRVWQ